MADMISLAEAQERLFALADPVAIEQVPLRHAASRWAAVPVAALRTQPELPLSAMDGYAIRFADLPGPWRVIGESAAGRPFAGSVAPGEAVRIFTGAAVPDGADTILVQEEAARDADALKLDGDGPPARGAHVRPVGLDFSHDAIVIDAGAQLTPARIALAAIAGHATLPVRRRIRIAIAATGDELRAPGALLGQGELPESNGAMLAAMLAPLPVDLIDLGILPDRIDALTTAFAAVDADLLVTSGGASVGDHDLVRPALAAAGAEIDFWRVAMRPGKPVMAGRMRDTVVIGLPGNPVSAHVTALLFVLPMVAYLSGAADPLPRRRTATLGTALPANGPRADHLRAVHRDGCVIPADRQDSSMLRVLAACDCLIVRAPHVPAAAPGDSVEILDIG
ncbi:molybdopterin molybdotransferase MoeA [Sphingomonas sp.]|uniref:molybdopterin molybdotransferase MoeA n=1 Tax=Sphingomonas sp. TaxID=28214 RepID=UPI0017B335C1|nr:molybdopterin molybdotransferase MoeA [Sphingomonas sp.]MBA4763648.1 molybdopterin molybdotransferase MoeA [Sphingomonas sp.]